MANDQVAIGDVVASRYRVRKGPFAGGTGEVWLAVDQKLNGRPVALKRILFVGGPDVLRLLRREQNILSGLNHSNIVTLYDVEPVGEPEARSGKYWLVMEWLPGGSLAGVVEAVKDKKSRLSARQVAGYCAQVADALAAAHEKGIIHGDVKPGNFFLTEDGRVKLGDFGTALNLNDSNATRSQRRYITLGYAAREVMHGARPERKSDVYSLGCSVCALMTGETPTATGASASVRQRRVMSGRVGPLKNLGPLHGLVTEMLAPRPENRPGAAEVAARLKRIAEHTEQDRRGRRWLRAAVAAAFVLVLGWLVGPPSGEPPHRGTNPTPREGQPGTATDSVLGRPRTADPCALIEPAAFGRFGGTELDPAYGAFSRCDLIINPEGEHPIDVEVQLDEGPPPEGARPMGRVGAIGIVTLAEESRACIRGLTLPRGDNDAMVVVSADYEDESGTTPLCAVADVATNVAARELDRAYQAGRQVGERQPPFPPNSLAHLDACVLLHGDALAAVIPGVDAIRPEVGYGRWECSWKSTSDTIEVELRFEQRTPLNASDGRPTLIDERAAFVTPELDGPGSCTVWVSYREYTGRYGHRKVEALQLSVRDRENDKEFPVCPMATDLATAAAEALP